MDASKPSKKHEVSFLKTRHAEHSDINLLEQIDSAVDKQVFGLQCLDQTMWEFSTLFLMFFYALFTF